MIAVCDSARSGVTRTPGFDGFRLNISSMRSVTRKPPTTLIVAKTTATNASAFSRSESAEPAMSIAPTRTMPWIAFVPDMSGVCSIAGTFEMISMPMNTARTKTVMLLSRVMAHAATGSFSTRALVCHARLARDLVLEVEREL